MQMWDMGEHKGECKTKVGKGEKSVKNRQNKDEKYKENMKVEDQVKHATATGRMSDAGLKKTIWKMNKGVRTASSEHDERTTAKECEISFEWY